MKIKYLAQALRFACLPTLSVLVLLFFGFFDISNTLAFISSNDGWAIFLRVILVIAETVLIVYMYYRYKDEDAINRAGASGKNGIYCSANNSIHALKKSWNYDDKVEVYPSDDDDIIIIKKVAKS